jgi:hypothetical protein
MPRVRELVKEISGEDKGDRIMSVKSCPQIIPGTVWGKLFSRSIISYLVYFYYINNGAETGDCFEPAIVSSWINILNGRECGIPVRFGELQSYST